MEIINAFNNHLPVKVRFGEGRALTLPDVLAEIGARHSIEFIEPSAILVSPLPRGFISPREMSINLPSNVTVLISPFASNGSREATSVENVCEF